jgi:hypothetical protein
VKFHKAWAPIWLYLIKEDKIRSCLSGAFEKIMEIVDTRKKRKKYLKSQPEQVIDKLLKCND